MIYDIFKKLDLTLVIDDSNDYEINIKNLFKIEINN